MRGEKEVSRPLETNDFRATRIVLEPDDFAASDGKPDRPTDIVDQETWHGIVDLPDDVSIRTSNHQGTILKDLCRLQGSWTTHAIGDNQDLLFEVLLYTIDELDAVLFNLLHGYYRQAIGCLRNIIELVVFGTYCQMAQNAQAFEQWRSGQMEISFGGMCARLLSLAPIQSFNMYLRAAINDTLIDQRTGPQSGGWARRLYAELCEYSHSRPDATNVGMWASNGPIYVPGAFQLTASLYAETLTFCYILIKLAKPQLTLPEEIIEQFEGYKDDLQIAYFSYTHLFLGCSADNAPDMAHS